MAAEIRFGLERRALNAGKRQLIEAVLLALEILALDRGLRLLL